MKTTAVFLLACFIAEASDTKAQDTIWIESPRDMLERSLNKRAMEDAIESVSILKDALHKIQTVSINNYAREVSRLSDIVDGLEPSRIVITQYAKEEYIKKIKTRLQELREEYEGAEQAIKISDCLKKFRPFYIHDTSMYEFYDRLSKIQEDSLYKIYLAEIGPEDKARYYFTDWMWLKFHHMLPETPQEKTVYYYDPKG